MSLKILEGNIVEAQVDAIVNAANPKMLGGGGVDGAIHRAAGPKLLEECRKVKATNGIRCPFGEARITPSGNLPCTYVIHTSGPIYRNEADPHKVLKASYENSLDLALKHDCRSVAIPAISCGAYGFPAEDAAKISIDVCLMQKYQDIDVQFYLYGAAMYEVWISAFAASG